MPIHLAGILQQQTTGGGGGAGIAYVGSDTYTSVTGTTLSLPVDPGASNDDTLFAVVHVNGNVTITPPSGWTEFWQGGSSLADDSQAGVWYRVQDGTEGATEDWTTAASQTMAGICFAYSGVGSVAANNGNAARTSAATGSFNTYGGTLPAVDADDFLLLVVCGRTGNTTNRSYTAAASMTERLNTISVPASFMFSDDGPISSAPAVDTWDAAFFNGTRRHFRIPIVLKG